jgi:hypothetical protein
MPLVPDYGPPITQDCFRLVRESENIGSSTLHRAVLRRTQTVKSMFRFCVDVKQTC